MARFRFETYSFYIRTDHNPWDEPSRVFDPPDVRKGPSPEELPEHMARRLDVARMLYHEVDDVETVSYTHLTLPTILLV